MSKLHFISASFHSWRNDFPIHPKFLVVTQKQADKIRWAVLTFFVCWFLRSIKLLFLLSGHPEADYSVLCRVKHEKKTTFQFSFFYSIKCTALHSLLQTHLFFEPFVVIRNSSVTVRVPNRAWHSPINNSNKFITKHKRTTGVSLKLWLSYILLQNFHCFEKFNAPNIFLAQLDLKYTKCSHAVKLKLAPRILRS